jgi:hypothetical protein
MDRYLDREAATALLASRGFNRLDIECVLDLTGSVSQRGTPLWPTHAIERLAARAWWLDRTDIETAIPRAA